MEVVKLAIAAAMTLTFVATLRIIRPPELTRVDGALNAAILISLVIFVATAFAVLLPMVTALG